MFPTLAYMFTTPESYPHVDYFNQEKVAIQAASYNNDNKTLTVYAQVVATASSKNTVDLQFLMIKDTSGNTVAK